MDIALAIRQFNQGREPERLDMKYANMRSGAFTFLRGTCHLFYRRLPVEAVLDDSPKAWICGDLHLENFGSYLGDNRLAYFDIDDFDEAALAPCSWDLARFLTSVRLGMNKLNLSPGDIETLCRTFLSRYARELAGGMTRWIERDTGAGLIGKLLNAIQTRKRAAFLDSRTELNGKRRKIRLDGRKALPINDRQRDKIAAFIADFTSRETISANQTDPKFFRVLDVARRISGTGSLGLERYAILVRGYGSPDGNFLLDLKQAQPSSLTPRLRILQPHARQPEWPGEAQRIVAIQRRVQAVSMAFLHPVDLDGQSYILRALQPSEDRVALKQWKGKRSRLEHLMQDMGALLAWGHLRASGREGSAIADELINFGLDDRWQRQIAEIAEHCAAQTQRDWVRFAQAYDDGYFKHRA